MVDGGKCLAICSFYYLLLFLVIGFLQVPWAASIVAPSSNCYALDNNSYIFDFSDWIGLPFEYDGKEEADLVVRFCKDVESRSSTGYVDFGRYGSSNYFGPGSGQVKFVQEFYNGDLLNCELHSFDKKGRTAQINIICGNCSNGPCQDERACICNVTYDSTMCRVLVELAISCDKNGSRVFEGFTVGFHPRSWEVVYNGMTQLGFEKPHQKFSFGTEQTYVSLYLTAISSLSGLVGKPAFKVNPDKGLEVKLSGSGASGVPPTTLSPSILNVNWRCELVHDTPYEVAISIPVEGYEPIEFSLTKTCEYKQDKSSDGTRGWATFGILSCVFMISSTLFCCIGFVYRTRVDRQHGLDALPGMAILSACLEALSGTETRYPQAENLGSTFINQASWERLPVSAQEAQRTGERKYGSI